jgi:hypothetical protein
MTKKELFFEILKSMGVVYELRTPKLVLPVLMEECQKYTEEQYESVPKRASEMVIEVLSWSYGIGKKPAWLGID